ncbi:hypothetical protein [Persicobacter psychrovividus]|uniref:Lipoprotein n=1 Tax=Persicobacter psychrovividus TaxID=387638 RepID=A0ABM7VDN8_9BACT|nr:hypothetical protein PEPS_10520 [Persicobacter psychrovividus]
MRKTFLLFAFAFTALSFSACSVDEIKEDVNCVSKFAQFIAIAPKSVEDLIDLNCDELTKLVTLTEELNDCDDLNKFLATQDISYDDYKKEINGAKQVVCLIEAIP